MKTKGNTDWVVVNPTRQSEFLEMNGYKPELESYGIGDWIKKQAASIKKDIQKVEGKVKEKVEDVKEKVKGKVEGAKEKAQNTMDKAKSKLGEGASHIKNAAKDGGKKLGKILKTAWVWTLKLNPVAAPFRAAVLVCIRVNLFGIATMLYPALLSQEELKKGGFSLSNAAKARKGLDKVKKFWQFTLGGDPGFLEKDIRVGFTKPPFKKFAEKLKKKQQAEANAFDGEQISNVAGVDDAAILAEIAQGAAAIGTMISILKSLGVGKNPYEAGKAPAGFETGENPPADMPTVDEKSGEYVLPEEMTAGELATGTLIGAGIGTGLGILIAHKTGKSKAIGGIIGAVSMGVVGFLFTDYAVPAMRK